MAYAAVTFVFNESVNLPVWIRYYGGLFGAQNLFVIDRCSDDGSTTHLGEVNHIKVPRPRFDEDQKTNMMSSFHAALTSVYDAVIVTDCDEILVPDPDYFSDLNDYISKLNADYVNGIGIDILHVINEEPPLDAHLPILAQRTYGRFHSPECKHLLSRTQTRWLPGLHSSNKPPSFDEKLFIFHMKFVDYGAAMLRQKINLGTEWSDQSLSVGYGAHHRWDLAQFVKQGFLVPIDLIGRKQVFDFEFKLEIAEILSRTVIDSLGNHRIPMDIAKIVRIPDRFRRCI